MMLADANRRAGNTIALTGEGADELLAGYVWFKWNRRPEVLRRFGAPISRLIVQAMSGTIGGGSTHRPSFAAAQGVRSAAAIRLGDYGAEPEVLYSPEMWNVLTRTRLRKSYHFPQIDCNDGIHLSVPVCGLQSHAAWAIAKCEGRPSTTAGVDRGAIRFSMKTSYSFVRTLRRVTSSRAGRINGYSDRSRRRVLPSAIAGRRKTMFARFEPDVSRRKPTFLDRSVA